MVTAVITKAFPQTIPQSISQPISHPALAALPIPTMVGTVSNQYHSQDEVGQARYGYSFPGQASSNYRDAYGNQIGSYAYFNPLGKEIRVSYTADSRGFRVLSNDIPVAVQETPEVAKARADHMAIRAAILARLPAVPASASDPVSAPVVPLLPASLSLFPGSSTV